MTPAIRNRLPIFLLLILFFAAGLLRLNHISLYSPDSAWYVVLGNSIAHGKGFLDDTKPYPDRNVLNAPLYSVLIAPVEVVFPRSLLAVKIWTLLWGCGAIAALYVWLARLLGRGAGMAGAILLAANPFMLIFSSEVLSEAPFICLLVCALLCVEEAADPVPELSTEKRGSQTGNYLLVLLLALLPLLREVGAGVAFSAILFLAIRKQWKLAGLVTVCCAAAFGLWFLRNNVLYAANVHGKSGNTLLLFQHFVTSADASMASEFIARAWINAKAYAVQLGGALFYPSLTSGEMILIIDPSSLSQHLSAFFTGTGKFITVLIAFPLMATGMFDDFRAAKGAIFRACALVLLLAAIAIYTVSDLRFLLAIFPFLIFYFVRGAKTILSYIAGSRWELAIVLAALILMIPNFDQEFETISSNQKYIHSSWDQLKRAETVPAVFTFPWESVGAWARANTPDDAVFASPTKDLALYVGNRKVIDIADHLSTPEIDAALRDNNVSYIVVPMIWDGIFEYEFAMKESPRYHFTTVAAVGNLRVLRVESRLRRSFQPYPVESVFDTTAGIGYLKRARIKYLAGSYIGAAADLRRSHELLPAMEEPVFELVESYALLGDTVQAAQWYHVLFTMPQNLEFTVRAGNVLHASEWERNARANAVPQFRAMQLLGAAGMYWDNGYRERAVSLSAELVRIRPDYFRGLLWAFHFHLETGDTAAARGYLVMLSNIDSSNAVTKAFTRIMALGDSVNSGITPKEKARCLLEEAEVYRAMELPQIAIDRAEMALGQDSTYLPALAFLGETFSGLSRLRTAEHYYGELLAIHPADPAASQALESIRKKLASI